MNLGEQLTLWAIYASMACYALVMAIQLGTSRWAAQAWLGKVWLAGVVFLAGHILLAMHVHHEWSHQRAVLHTAELSERVLGWRFGSGIYFNYLFAMVWLGDAVWWTRWPASHRCRSGWLNLVIHVFLFFIAFNGAVVFAAGMSRWCSMAVALAILAALLVKSVRERIARPEPPMLAPIRPNARGRGGPDPRG